MAAIVGEADRFLGQGWSIVGMDGAAPGPWWDAGWYAKEPWKTSDGVAGVRQQAKNRHRKPRSRSLWSLTGGQNSEKRRRAEESVPRLPGGLAVGDALGAPLEFHPPGTFEPIENMVSGGAFNLQAGQWTDDTAMALCLADSLIACEASIRWTSSGGMSAGSERGI